MFTYYILPKCAKTREPEDEHCVSWCTYTSDNKCDPLPLDKLKNHTALPYITIIIQQISILEMLLNCNSSLESSSSSSL